MTTLISREELVKGIEARTLTVVDTLPAGYFAQQHLPGAINLTAGEVPGHADTALPDKNAQIVTYCTGPICQNSSQVAAALEARGYLNVRRYADGIEDWVRGDLPTEAAR